ncbi:MAG: hypothetical protein JW781_02565 [Deltaproteobacteria bacterium]|nr:hypothetical protein [Candidatus Anaeroferrophillacea bacterium]
MNTERMYHVMGGGRFGTKAVRRLLELDAGCRIRVVETDAAARAGLPDGARLTVIGDDAVAYCCRLLAEPGPADWIIPTVPVHLAAAVIRRLVGRAFLPWPGLPELPGVATGPDGTLYASLADFICPDDCPQPADHCHQTGLPREKTLITLLADGLFTPERPVFILPSRQLAPGVGGYPAADLLSLHRAAAEFPDRPVVIGTACLCHGAATLMGPAADARVVSGTGGEEHAADDGEPAATGGDNFSSGGKPVSGQEADAEDDAPAPAGSGEIAGRGETSGNRSGCGGAA